MKIVILGAGPAGLAAGWKLSEAGCEVTIIELEKQVGGLCRSLRRDGFIFDLGGHRFLTKDDDLEREISSLVGEELKMRPRKSMVRLRGKYFRYPLGGIDLLKKLDPAIGIRCFSDYLITRYANMLSPRRDVSFEDWVVNRFGRSLYNIYFGPYSQKLWGMSPRQISADWAAQRISLLNLWDVFMRLLGQTKDVPKTYATKFLYPTNGIGAICECMADRLVKNGGKIFLGAKVDRIVMRGKRPEYVRFKTDDVEGTIGGDYFISTISLPEFINILEPVPDRLYLNVARAMRFRSLRFLFIMLDLQSLTDNTWTYIPEKDCLFFRIQEPKNWADSTVPYGKTSLILEIACDRGDDIWNADEAYLYNCCMAHLRKLNIVGRIDKYVMSYFTERLSHAYPIYDLNYRAKMRLAMKLIMGFENLLSIGRQGLFRYNNMDHSIKMGFLTAAHILNNLPKEEIFKVAQEEVAFELER